MPSTLRITLAALLSAAAATALAQPATGIDLSNLTPKTPSQKAAADANANGANGSQTSNQKSMGGIGPFAPGASSNQSPAGSNATTKDGKTTMSLIKSPFGNNAKSTPAASDDASASSNDVQVKIPGKK